MLTPPECFDRPREEDDNASDAPHHPLGRPDARGGDGLVVVTEPVMAALLQLHVERASSSGHRMPGVRTECPACVAPPDVPGFAPIAAEERGAGNNQQGWPPGRKQVQRLFQ